MEPDPQKHASAAAPFDSAAVEAKRLHDQVVQTRRRHLLPRAFVAGILAGLLGVAFRLALEWGGEGRSEWLGRMRETLGEAGWIVTALLCAIAGAVAVWLVKQFAPEASGSGIPHVKAVISGLRTMRWIRTTLVKFFGGVLAIGSGMALGREGPTVQMGAAMGQLVGEKSGSGDMERRNLVSAGAAAGLTAAFNAPLAGILFVIEELHGKITPNTFFGAFIACVTADTVMRLSLGQEPYFGLMNFDLMPLGLLPAFVLLGLFAGWGGVLFNKSMIIALDFFAAPRKGLPVWWPGAAVGAGVGLVAWFLPDAVGDGHKLWQMMFEMRFAFGAIAGLFLLRFVMSVLCYGTGAPGGIFAPILVLGGFLGLALGMAAQIVFPDMGVNPVLFTVAGMGAFLTGSVRAPLTSMVLIVEMSGDYNLMLPLLVACLSAYGAAELTGDKAIYEALLERDIARGQAAAVPSPAKGQS